MRFHVEMETEKNIKLGMSPEDARLKALRSFGPMEKHKEETRDARGVSWLETLVADLRYGARALFKHPGYALLAVLTLGLGIGANTAIFSVINGVLLKPLPYEHGDRLVVRAAVARRSRASRRSASPSPNTSTIASAARTCSTAWSNTTR